MVVERTDFVSVPVIDMERSTGFYRDTLGLEALGAPRAPRARRRRGAPRELESRGVAFQGDTVDTGVCHVALFRDPAGNQLMLHRRYAPVDRSAKED